MTAKMTASTSTANGPSGKHGSRSGRAGSGSLNGACARDREVIEAAVQIFWEKGYASASVQDVADALGMLKGSLYYYIDLKEGLLDKIFQDSHDDLMRLTQKAADGDGSAAGRPSRFLRDYAMWTLTHIERAGLYSREWRYASDTLRPSLGEPQRYYDRNLRKLIIAEQEEGSVDSTVEPRTASLFIWAAWTGLPDWYRPGTAADAEGVASALVTLGQEVRAS